MRNKIIFVGAAALLFLGKPVFPVYATEVTSSEIVTSSEEEQEVVPSSSEEVPVIEEEGILPEIIQEQLDQLESIIVALFASFVGTGTVAMIIRLALSKLTKEMTKKVTAAEAQNKISTKQAQDAITSILAFENILQGQVTALEETVKDLIKNQNITNENIKMMLDEYKTRDEQIKDLIIKEFGDDINE